MIKMGSLMLVISGMLILQLISNAEASCSPQTDKGLIVPIGSNYPYYISNKTSAQECCSHWGNAVYNGKVAGYSWDSSANEKNCKGYPKVGSLNDASGISSGYITSACSSVPCENGGFCNPDGTCYCNPGYSGTKCETVLEMETNSDGTLFQDVQDKFVSLHNTDRSNVGLGSVTWDANLAAFAQNYIEGLASQCTGTLVHSSDADRDNIAGYVGQSNGENLAYGTMYASDYGVEKANQLEMVTRGVGSWSAEINYYNITTNQCDTGKKCGHYTQNVWDTLTKIGCGLAICHQMRAYYVGCVYNPVGNVKINNVVRRPYNEYCMSTTCQNGGTCGWGWGTEWAGLGACTGCSTGYGGRDCSTATTTTTGATVTHKCLGQYDCNGNLDTTLATNYTDASGTIWTYHYGCYPYNGGNYCWKATSKTTGNFRFTSFSGGQLCDACN